MEVEERFTSQSFQDQFSEWKGTRRDFLKSSGKKFLSAFAVGAIGTGWRYKDEAIKMFEGGSVRDEFDSYVKEKGFIEVSDDRQQELLGDPTSFSEIEVQEYPSLEQDGLVDIAFRTEEPSFLVVSVEGAYDDKGSLPVVTATNSFNELEYVIPILQTRLEKSQSFALKTVPPGEHLLQFRRTNAAALLGEGGIHVTVKIPDQLTPFGQAVMESLPILGMQKECALQEVYTNDAPFFRDGYLYERDSDGLVRVGIFEGRTAEDGGIGKDPIDMDRQLDRLFDFDHSVIPTIGSEDGLLYELAHQEDKFRSHRIVTDAIFPSGIDPKRVQERFLYHSVPDHGMVKKGLERERNGRLLHNKVYSLYPDFYPQIDSFIEEERMRVRKLIAVREYQRENKSRMDQLAEMYQSYFTPENFPEQFEISAFLSDEEEQLLAE